jgi:pSer/pThr/pTyr-binding forkhead associated (FHA) protein
MAKLLVKTSGLEKQLIELRLGANRIGRGPDNDFRLSHPTISTIHCEMFLAEDGIIVRDLESTNGTFVGGNRVREVKVQAGETIRLGDVDLFVESTEFKVAIPKFVNTELPAPPVIAQTGGMFCPRHSHAHASYQCSHCNEVMCAACVHRLRRKGSKNVLLLCPVCSHSVQPIGGPQKQKKKSLFARVSETVKLKLTRSIDIGK